MCMPVLIKMALTVIIIMIMLASFAGILLIVILLINVFNYYLHVHFD